jgi:hypothetical protein
MNHSLHNWIPYRLHLKDEALVEWLYIKDKKFEEPFFDETIVTCKSFDQNSKDFRSASSIDWLSEAVKSIEHIAPTAFIFHVSRCGSTLLSQLLSINDEHIVLSEVPLFDEILRTYKGDAGSALQASVKLMGQARTGKEKHLFIKLDSWHIFYWRIIRKLYPNVPFILLYRSPAEVIRSHSKLRGMHMVPGLIEPSLFGFHENEIHGIPFDEYSAKVLTRFYSAFSEVIENDKHALAVDYEEGMMNIMQKLAHHADITFSSSSLQAMEERSKYHSKHPGQVFSEPVLQTSQPHWLIPAIKAYQKLSYL